MATVPSTPRTNFITLGAPGAGPFNVGFRLFEASAITVYVNGTKTTAFTLSADFSLGYDDSATITLSASQILGTTIQIDGTMVADREEDYANPDPGMTRKLNTELGRVWASVSELWQQARRSVRGLSDVEPDGALDGVDFAALANSAPEAAASAAAALASQQAVEAIEATLPEWKGAWVTATAYQFGDLVQQSGSTYICIVNHTSGTFNTDLAALRWEIFAQKGTAGAGIGDVVAANNGSEYTATAATFRANVGLVIGTAIQAFNQLLAAIAGLGANGIIVRTSGSTAVVRTITGTANQVTVTNGDGVSGNPTLAAVIASQAEAEAGADTTKLMTAQRVAQAIAALATGGTVAEQTLSGAGPFDFVVPATATEITIQFDGPSLSGTDSLLVQIGDAGGVETAGYVGSGNTTDSTTGFIVAIGLDARAVRGLMTLSRVGATNKWIQGHSAGLIGFNAAGGGSKTLSAPITTVRILATGGNTFDGGGLAAIRYRIG